MGWLRNAVDPRKPGATADSYRGMAEKGTLLEKASETTAVVLPWKNRGRHRCLVVGCWESAGPEPAGTCHWAILQATP